MKLLLSCLFAFTTSLLFSQNTFHRIIEVNKDQQWLRSSAAGVSNASTKLFIYQQGGAVLSGSGGSTGEVNDLLGAGHYDLNRVVRVGGDTIFMDLPVKHDYNSLHSQVVLFNGGASVPVFGVQSTEIAYDGSLGGVTFIAADEQIVFQPGAFLNAKGVGFRGGVGVEVVSDCNLFTAANGLGYGAGDWRGSSRGEGIGGFPVGQPFGRAAAGNGGGGGNDHNAGGGGGANISVGGTGARNIVRGVFNTACRGNFPGFGGRGLEEEDERIYFGGGGGAGHANNASSSDGGNGGGLIVLWAPMIDFGTSAHLSVNGTSGATVDGDGGGGGGAAGTILLASNTLTGSVNLDLVGGNGADVDNQPSRCFGPGGGGAGGRLLTTATNRQAYNPNINLSGGAFGQRLGSNECNPNDEPAETGDDGEEEEIPLVLPFAGFSQNADMICGGEVIRLTDESSGAIRVEWTVFPESDDLTVEQLGDDLRITTTPLAEGTFRAAQTLFVDDLAYPGDTAVFTVISAATLESVTVVYGPETVSISVIGGSGYELIRYDFGDGTVIDTSATSLEHTYVETGEYITSVTLLNASCGDVVFEDDDFVVAEFASADADLKSAEGCAPLTFSIVDRSTGTYEDRRWNFPGGSPEVSNEARPTVTYTEPGEYSITLTLLEAVGADTIRIIPVTVYAQPAAAIGFTVDTATAAFTNGSTDGSDFFWDFGDNNTSIEENPVHTYGATGTYTVSLLTVNGTCRDSISLEVTIDVLSDLADLQALGVRVFPNPTSGLLTITGPARVAGVFDLAGRQLLGGREEGTQDLSALPSGVYMVGVLAGGRTHWVRVVKR